MSGDAQSAETADVRGGLEAAVERAREIVAEGYAEPEDLDVINIAECLLTAQEALREIVRREARSEYASIYAAPSEFAAVARAALAGLES